VASRVYDWLFVGSLCFALLSHMPAVSVVIPAFNSAEYLGEAIQSVLNQSVQASEILVVDDGSTDQTRAVAQQYPVSYTYQRNAGPSAARNTGIAKSTGDFVAFLDADDLWAPHKIELQLSGFQKYPDAGFSFSTVWNLYEGSSPAISKEPYFPPHLMKWLRKNSSEDEFAYGSAYALLLYKNCVATSSVMIRRALIQQIEPFDVRLRGCEDYEYWLRLARSAPAVFIRHPVSRYRVLDGGLSGTWQSRYERFHDTAMSVLQSHMQAFPSLMVRRAIGAALAEYGFYCLTLGRGADALTVSRRALAVYPTVIAMKTFFEASLPSVYSFLSSVAHLRRSTGK